MKVKLRGHRVKTNLKSLDTYFFQADSNNFLPHNNI